MKTLNPILKKIEEDFSKQKFVPDRIYMTKEEFDMFINWAKEMEKDENNKVIT